MTNNLLCCESLSSRMKRLESPFALEGDRITLSFPASGRITKLFLFFCPFCGVAFSKTIDSSHVLSKSQMAVAENLLDGILTRADALKRLGPPSKEIYRANQIINEIHYDHLIDGVSIVLLERENGSLESMYSWKQTQTQSSDSVE